MKMDKKLLNLILFVAIFLIFILGVSADECCVFPNGACEPITGNFLAQQQFEQACNSAQGEILPQACDSAAQCAKGCCVDTNSGDCSPETTQVQCSNLGDGMRFDNTDSTCFASVPECVTGCCVNGPGSVQTEINELKCTIQGGSFTPGVTDLEQCIESSNSIEEGACVFGVEGTFSCRRTSMTDCNTFSDKISFNPNYLCSHFPETECRATSYTSCYGGDNGKEKIYWFDSCGNQENIYLGESSGEKANSLAQGKITNVAESCQYDSDSQNKCGNCAYKEESTCGNKRSNGIDPSWSTTDSDLTCISLDCAGTKENPIYDNGVDFEDKQIIFNRHDKSGFDNLGFAKHGESWCIFDGYSGYGKDPVGSEQWRGRCEAGIFSIEKIGDKRSSICIERVFEGKSRTTIQDNTQSFAICNRYNEEKTTLPDEEWLKNCENDISCVVISGVCVPKVPLGMELNPLNGMEADQTKTPGGDVKDSCDTNFQLLEGLGFDTRQERNNLADYFEFWLTRNNVCHALGDCGTYINYIGEGGGILGGGSGRATSPEGVIFGNHEEWRIYIGEEGYLPFIEYENWYFSRERTLLGLEPKEYYLGGKDNLGRPRFFNFAKPIQNQFITTINANIGETEGLTNGRTDETIDKNYLEEAANKFSGGQSWLDNLDVQFHCNQWYPPKYDDPATAKKMCEKCNNDPLGKQCTQYKCESLGADCIFYPGSIEAPMADSPENPTNSNEDECKLTRTCPASNTPYCLYQPLRCDENTPELKVQFEQSIINSPLDRRFSPFDYNVGQIIWKEGPGPSGEHPSTNQDACLDENQNMNFIINTNIPSDCKIFNSLASAEIAWDENNPSEDGIIPYESGAFVLNHTFNYPTDYIENYQTTNAICSGTVNENNRECKFELYVTCKPPACTEPSPKEIKMCVKEGVDKTAPSLFEFNPADQSYVAFNQHEKEVKMYINKPAECKWSKTSKLTFEEHTDGTFDCPDSVDSEANEEGKYECSTTLNGFENGTDNIFYIRCQDKPWETDSTKKNTGSEWIYTLKGSVDKLKIDKAILKNYRGEVELNESKITEIKTNLQLNTFEIIVQTSGGFDGSGGSNCSYIQDRRALQEFWMGEGSPLHNQPGSQWGLGNHELKIICVDVAGNSKEKRFGFNVVADRSEPEVVRAYNDGGVLTVITDEDADCYYNNFPYCNPFDINNATLMEGGISKIHTTFADSSKTYYIKCRDIFGKINSDCAIIVKPQ